MNGSRFEKFIRKQISEMVEPAYAELRKKLDAEEAKAEKLIDHAWGLFLAAAEKGVREAVAYLADKDVPRSGKPVDEIVRRMLESQCRHTFRRTALRVRPNAYDDSLDWPVGTKVREYADKIREIDSFVESEVNRLVVYKKDLGMKAGDFEKELAEVCGRAAKFTEKTK